MDKLCYLYRIFSLLLFYEMNIWEKRLAKRWKKEGIYDIQHVIMC